MMIAQVVFLVALLSSNNVGSQKLINDHGESYNTSVEGTQWAVLVAGSNGFENYRHQADVCHAYQILRKGGLKDKNIVVFMYDDIAFNEYNPRPGIIINKPYGEDVYDGVPKDYTGNNCTAKNFLAVILGNKTALTGGSGKVVDSGPLDQIFIYYSDHGSAGLVDMPSGDPLFSNDLVDVLKQKHASKTYKSIVFYLEACESGSMFEGLLPTNLSIYAVTAANASESSFATYCPWTLPGAPSEFSTCLGDLFSVSWMEDSDLNDLTKETLLKQYQVIRRRTAEDSVEGSHVMQYGDLALLDNPVFLYLGNSLRNDNNTLTAPYSSSSLQFSRVVDQRDASLLTYWHKYNKAEKGTKEKVEAKRELSIVISHRRHVDNSFNRIATILFGENKCSEILKLLRPSGQPLVDDWDCLKTLVKVYEKQCGGLSRYGRKYTRAIANMCNAGVTSEQMTKASTQACSFS